MSMIGRTLGNFELISQIGKGGMGEVYQAKDHKLGRDVAIKVLPEEFARDTERVARFQREAKLLASLNHPNIAAIHGLEEADGAHFLVLELIEGQTLAERIKGGPVPVEEALKLGLQIAEALEAAHEKGVIHRDLKPANIKVTPDGKVKVLDFGLAKAYAGDSENINLSNSPTLSDLATQQGVILGTAAYMPPEQAKGKSVDKRADIWAFGVVLFEMLSGRQLFSGESVSETLAAVIKSEPEWDNLPPNLHHRIRLMLERCLEKEPKNRYGAVNDARVDIEKVLADPGGVYAQPVTAAESQKKLQLGISWVATVAILAIIIGGVVIWYFKPSPSPLKPRSISYDYDLPEGQELNITSNRGHTLAVSPDGSQFIYSTSEGLYIHYEDELEARLIPGTDDNPQSPFFSPDGRSVGYWSQADGKLKKIPIRGGAPVALCDVVWVYGAKWYPDNTIVYSDIMGGIMRVSANSGNPELLVSGITAAPQLLPGGKSVLFTDVSSEPYKIAVQSIESGERKELFAGYDARYLPTGHIVYNFENNIYAVQFNPETLEETGGQATIVQNVLFYAISDEGILVYLPGTIEGDPGTSTPKRTLVWVDMEGNEEPLDAPPNKYAYPKISPDGTKVALTIDDGQDTDIHIWDLAEKVMRRLTFNEGSDIQSIWTSDGERIVFRSDRGEKSGIYCKAADGRGTAEFIGSAPDRILLPWSWSKDGNTIVTQEVISLMQTDIGTLSMDEEHTRKTLLHDAEYAAVQPKISPDGKYMAYGFGKALRTDVYVCSFPDVTGGKWHISTNSSGGSSPLWSPDGSELFYISNDNSIMAVAVNTEPTFKNGAPKVLFQNIYTTPTNTSGTPWDIHPHDNRFLMIKPPKVIGNESTDDDTAQEIPRKINVVTNWFEELKERVPVP
jgi:serine/threonine protein kinase